MRKIAIIGCTSAKESYPCKAIELYQKSSLFRKELKYAQIIIKADDIYILSAKHHLIHGSKIIEPYNVTLINKSKAERIAWADFSLSQILKEFNPTEDKLYLLCGAKYYEFLEGELKKNNYQYEIPLKGIGKIGEQLQWLNQNT